MRMPTSRSTRSQSKSASTAQSSSNQSGSNTTSGGSAKDSRVDGPHETRPTRFVASTKSGSDRATVTVLDQYWIRIGWELSEQTLTRAEKAFGRNWSKARPVVRICGVGAGETSAHEVESSSDVEVPGDAREWFVACPDSVEVEAHIGYLSDGPDGRFFSLAVSEPVSTRQGHSPTLAPEAGLPDEVIAELQRMRTGSEPFTLAVSADLVIFGKTSPGATVSIGDASVVADSGGRFEHRHELENGRTVLPLDARSSCGKESRSGVVSTDFNMRVLEQRED